MKRKKISHLSTEDLVEYLREKVIAYSEVMGRRATKKELDDTYSDVLSAITEIDSREPSERLKLSRLLFDEHPAVRLHAATSLKEIALEQVLPVYEELANSSGIVSFSAQNALDRINGVDRFKDGPPPLTP
ncbi:MAG: hypothetical protein ACK46X_02425 [Candidatus Sericytochromatia bacterium]